MAVSQILTLALNSSTVLFRPLAGIRGEAPFCTEMLQRMDAFCIGRTHLTVVRWLCVLGLVVVASGWRPRFTGVLHWWLAASYQLSASTLEGGDQAIQVLTLLLIPVCLTDDRVWHWDAALAPEHSDSIVGRKLLACCGLLAARIQVSGIYFHAAVGKLKGPEWVNGTAMYYWLLHPLFGVARPLRHLALQLLANSYVVAGVTWGSIVMELALFAGLFATRPVRKVLFVLGLMFHLGIMVLMGLGTFSLTMWAALILYLRPADEPFTFWLRPSYVLLKLASSPWWKASVSRRHEFGREPG